MEGKDRPCAGDNSPPLGASRRHRRSSGADCPRGSCRACPPCRRAPQPITGFKGLFECRPGPTAFGSRCVPRRAGMNPAPPWSRATGSDQGPRPTPARTEPRVAHGDSGRREMHEVWCCHRCGRCAGPGGRSPAAPTRTCSPLTAHRPAGLRPAWWSPMRQHRCRHLACRSPRRVGGSSVSPSPRSARSPGHAPGPNVGWCGVRRRRGGAPSRDKGELRPAAGQFDRKSGGVRDAVRVANSRLTIRSSGD